jgi:hypothetical protein
VQHRLKAKGECPSSAQIQKRRLGYALAALS